MAESGSGKRATAGKGRASAGRADTKSSGSGSSKQREKGRGNQAQRSGGGSSSRTAGSASSSRTASSNRKNGLSASDAVARAREALSELIGRPVEGVLGIDRDQGNWVATVQVVEMARIPNTTDVLGEYETVLDGKGDVVRYHRKRRYHRGQIDGNQQ
jgi:hypothetical protein